MLIILTICVAVINIPPAFSNLNHTHRNKRSDEYVPCERGWYYFRDRCYKAVGRKPSERIVWDRALERCKSMGADLVSIQSQEEQDFVIAFLQLDVKYWTSIGLNDKDVESDYRWTDGSVFNYTNWRPGDPDGRKGDGQNCVHMLFEPANDVVGKWNDRTCSNVDAYICETNANYRKRSPNPMYCSSEAGGGWKYGSSCYHIVTEIKSWQNAERHCKDDYKGHLVTISDTLEDIFLDYILSNIKEELWIGIKVQNQLQQKWTSGWYVSYDGFKNDDLSFIEGTCVARKKRKEWIIHPCSKQLSFICEVSKERPPVLKLPPKGSHCPKHLDWRDLGGEYCYHVETDRSKRKNFYEASFDCKRRGGDLVSLHSKEESDILRPFVRYTGWSIYIGLIRLMEQEDAFIWTDGSDLNYQNWHDNEPNKAEEKCVEAVTENMKWYDCSCEQKKGYICSIKKIIPDSSAAKMTDCERFCIPSTSYLYGIVIQCSDAKHLS